ncbi:flagellar hook-associated protein 2 [Alkalibaculum bacchi]|uniref:Flagellar hook-associated protein 2 n=1 Tax=Alkalibaculum bacchi TaxID=645887 RepID=A0A366IHY3_9FIRM|nr:flagellar filament capping protein FliD [Alkalibaculum bacchi]RBP70114.1 flagellar hook-associated protein 2 [Alkalibaculum bacchi]
MAGINFIGSYSGIDQTSIDKLMEAEKLPLVQLSNKKTNLTAKQNAWKDINTRLNSLNSKLSALTKTDTLNAKSSTSTNENTVSITASKNTSVGDYKIHVERLATSTSVLSGKISLPEGGITKALDISGTFTIKNSDDKSVDITIEAGDSLSKITSKINDASKDTGISATIIDDQLYLTDAKTGNRAITLSEAEGSTVLGKLGLTTEAGKKVEEGTTAKFTINGVSVERNSNEVKDVLQYTTIHLKNTHEEGKHDTVKVSLDTSKLSGAIQDFVDQYNSTMTFIEDKLAAGDPKIPGSGGTLAGDSTLMRLHSSLRNLVTSTIGNENTTIKDISELGVTTIDKFGKLQFDSSKLTEALEKDPQNVANFFNSKDSKGEESGFGVRLNDYINSYITSDKGIIKGKTESLEKTLEDLNDQIDRFNLRMEKKQAQYIKMFTALDVAMMEAESQMSWLVGQIDAMNVSKK